MTLCTHDSDKYLAAMVTKALNGNLRAGLDPSDIMHAPLGFGRMTLKKSKSRCPNLDEEASSIVEKLKRLDFLLRDQPVVSTGHLKLIQLFDTIKWYQP